MDFHAGFMFVCLLAIANILAVSCDSTSYEEGVENEVQGSYIQGDILDGQIEAGLNMEREKKPRSKIRSKNKTKKKNDRKPGKKPGKRPNKKGKPGRKKKKANGKVNGKKGGGKVSIPNANLNLASTAEYNPNNEKKPDNYFNGTEGNGASIEDIKNEVKEKIEEIRNHTHNSFNHTEKRNGTTRNLSHKGFVISGGPSPNEGNVFYDGKPICDDYWDNNDASVLCRMLGYLGGTATHHSKYGQVSNDFSMDDVRCNGDEISLTDCTHTTRDNCRGHEGAGVNCHGFSISGGPSQQLHNEGNIFYNGKPICDDYWDDTDAGVFCRMMGYQFGTATHSSRYGQVSHDFSMDDVHCTGNEISLLDCRHTTREDCGGGEGAGVFCNGFSIHGGPSRYEGNVFYNGRPICDDYWDNNDAQVFCRMMGYGDGKATWSSKYGKVTSNFILDDVRCTGGETDLLQCSHLTNHNCGSHEGAGVICSGCNCLNHMSPYGFGNCKRHSPALGGKMCYVNPTSSCTDKLPSLTEKGLHKSAVACSQCPNKRRRKNVATLTSTEKERLRTSLRIAIASTTAWKNYADIASFHSQPYYIVCSPRRYCCDHGTKFLTWHRLFVLQMEQLLNEALPYWDWTQSGTVPDLWDGIYGPIKDPHRSTGTDCVGNDKTRSRPGKNIWIDAISLKEQTKLAFEETTYTRFSIKIQSVHDTLHVAMKCDMAEFESSAYDPYFWLHHTYVDYQFAYWQELQRLRGLSADLTFPDDILRPFDDSTYNKYEITRKNYKGKDTIDYENKLCYEYDNLIFDGKTPQEFLRSSRNGHSSRIFVGVALPKIAPSTVIAFEICNKRNKCIKGGSLATFGPSISKSTRKSGNITFNNFKMIEYEITKVIKEDGSFDTGATARISSNDDFGIMSGLEPIMIWRNTGGVKGGVAYLPKGTTKNDYGNFLNKYDDVKENVPK